MSDIEQPRADDGTFAAYVPPTVPPALDSYVPIEEGVGAADPEAAIEDTPIPTREELVGDYLTEAEKPEPLELKLYSDIAAGEEMPENVSVTVEQAGQILSNYESSVETYVNQLNDDDLKSVLDQDLAQLSPAELAERGRDPLEVAQNNTPEQQPLQQEQQRPDTATRPDDENAAIARALEIPKVREFLESNLAQAEAAKQQYLQAIDGANRAGLQRLESLLSETNIGRLPTVEAREAAFMDLARTNPALYVQAQAEMQSIVARQNFQAQHQQQQAYARQQQMESLCKSEDARLVEMVGAKTADEANAAVVNYLASQGVPRNQMFDVIAQNPVLQTAEGRHAVWKIAQYDRLMAAPKAVPVRERLPSQRPGAGERAPSVSRLESKADLTEAEGWALLQQRMSRG
jgi:hypothetical protein